MADCDVTIRQAIELIRSRRFQEAIALLVPAEREARVEGKVLDRIRLLRHAGICHFELDDSAAAEACFKECLDQANAIDSDLERVNAQHELSLIYARRQELDKAIDANKDAVRILSSATILPGAERMGGKDQLLAQHAQTLGVLLMEKGELDKSERALRVAEKAFATLADNPGLARTLNELGLVALQQKNPTVSAEAFCRSIALKVELQDMHGIQTGLRNVQVLLQRHPEARMVPCIQDLIAQLSR